MGKCHIYIVPLTFNQVYFSNKFRESGVLVVGLDDNKKNIYKNEVDYFLSCDHLEILELEKKLINKSSCLGIFGCNSDFGMRKSKELSVKTGLKNNFDVGDNKWIFDKYSYLKKINKENTVYLSSELKSNNYKYISKPRYGSGSKHISQFIFKNKSNINVKNDIIFQRKFHGAEYSIDGINFNGNIKIFTISKRIVNSNFSALSIHSLNNKSLIYRNIKNFIISLKEIFADNTVFPFHLEIINDKNLGFHVIDFSPRGGGFSLGDFFIEKTIKLQIADIYLNLFSNPLDFLIPNFHYNYSIIWFLPFQKGIFKSLKFDKKLLSKSDKFILLIKKNTKMTTPKNDGHRIGYFILSSRLKKDLNIKLIKLKESIKYKITDKI